MGLRQPGGGAVWQQWAGAPSTGSGQLQPEGPWKQCVRLLLSCFCCSSWAGPPLFPPSLPPHCPAPPALSRSLHQLPACVLEVAPSGHWHQLRMQAAGSYWGSGCPPWSAGNNAVSIVIPGSHPSPRQELADSIHSSCKCVPSAAFGVRGSCGWGWDVPACHHYAAAGAASSLWAGSYDFAAADLHARRNQFAGQIQPTGCILSTTVLGSYLYFDIDSFAALRNSLIHHVS